MAWASEAEYILTRERALCLGPWTCVRAGVGVLACVHVDVCVGVYIHAYVCIWVCVCPYNAETAEFLNEGSSSLGLCLVRQAAGSGWEAHLCDAAGGSVCFGLLPDVVQRLRLGPGCFRSLACQSLTLPSASCQLVACCQSACVNKASGGEGGS